jgi:hypothetical protein
MACLGLWGTLLPDFDVGVWMMLEYFQDCAFG